MCMTWFKNSINSQVVNISVWRLLGSQLLRKQKIFYKVKFADLWTKSFPIGRVNDNQHAFYCIPCKKSISGAHMGINDVKEHCKGTIHKQNEEAIKMTRKISFSSSNSDDSDFTHQVLWSEVKHTNFFIEHNIRFAVVNHLLLMYVPGTFSW